jgi:DNA-binding NarL/FixJ family response regulator
MKKLVAVVEDDPDCRSFLKNVVDSSDKYKCIASYQTGEEALMGIPLIRPKFVIVDVVLPGMSGLECTRHLKQLLPNVWIIVISGHVFEDNISQIIKAGADGYLRKPFTIGEFFRTLDQIDAEGISLSPLAAKYLVEIYRKGANKSAKVFGITRRECEILEQVEHGHSHKQIASSLRLSESTVNNHLRNAYRKLGVHNAHEATAKLRSV